MKVDIFIPTYKKHEKLLGIVQHLHETADYPFDVYFIVEDDDVKTKDALTNICNLFTNISFLINTGIGINECHNLAFRMTTGEFFVIAADDLIFSQGWLKKAMEEIGDKGVLAFTDKNAAGWGHFLVRREYIDNYSGVADEKGVVFHGYRHEYADAEFQFTARHRGQIVYSRIEIDHHDPRYFGVACFKDGDVKKLSKCFLIRDLMIPYSDITVEAIKNPLNHKETAIEIKLTPKNPIIVDEEYIGRKDKIHDASIKDRAEFESRAHLWGGQTVENLFEAPA